MKLHNIRQTLLLERHYNARAHPESYKYDDDKKRISRKHTKCNNVKLKIYSFLSGYFACLWLLVSHAK